MLEWFDSGTFFMGSRFECLFSSLNNHWGRGEFQKVQKQYLTGGSRSLEWVLEEILSMVSHLLSSPHPSRYEEWSSGTSPSHHNILAQGIDTVGKGPSECDGAVKNQHNISQFSPGVSLGKQLDGKSLQMWRHEGWVSGTLSIWDRSWTPVLCLQLPRR